MEQRTARAVEAARRAAVLPCLLGGLLSCLLGDLLSSLLRGLLRSLLCRPVGGLLGGLLRRKIGLALRFLGAQRFGSLLRIHSFVRFCLFLCAMAFLFDGFLHAQTGLLSGLCPRCRKIPVLCAVQIGPGVESRYVLRGIVRVNKRFAISHVPPMNPQCFDSDYRISRFESPVLPATVPDRGHGGYPHQES